MMDGTIDVGVRTQKYLYEYIMRKGERFVILFRSKKVGLVPVVCDRRSAKMVFHLLRTIAKDEHRTIAYHKEDDL